MLNNITAESITSGFTLSLNASQEALEAELLKHGYQRSLIAAAGEHTRAQQGGLVTSMPKGKMLFLETLSSVEDWLIQMVSEAMTKKRKPKFYTELIEPFVAMFIKDQAKHTANKFYQPKYENPLQLLAFFFTRELTKSMIQEDRMMTEVCRRIVNSYTMAFNNFDEATNEQLTATIQLVRTYILAKENLFFTEWSNAAGVHLSLNEKFKSLYISKEELLETVPDDKSPYKPMLVEPVDHHNLLSVDGGYITLQSPLLKYSEQDEIRQLPFNSNGTGKNWFREINNMQKTAWQVNVPFLEWLKKCDHPEIQKYFNTDVHKMQLACNKTVAKKEYAIRKLNKEISNARFETSQTTSIEKKIELERLIANNVDQVELLNMEIEQDKSEVGKARGWEETLADAEFFKSFDKFYHPVFCDNRGRVYTYNTSLSFQGSGLAKSIVQTFKKERMTEDAVEAVLELLGGMVDGWSKKKKEARVAMVLGLKSGIIDLIEGRNYALIELLDGDEILSALALMHELYHHWTDPEYKTGVIAYIDSTSSAIQVQALAQRCSKAAALTNLIKSEGEDLPDAYKAVAQTCQDLVKDISQQSNETLYATMVMYFMENSPERLEYTGINIKA